jgi:hypothetical protein
VNRRVSGGAKRERRGVGPRALEHWRLRPARGDGVNRRVSGGAKRERVGVGPHAQLKEEVSCARSSWAC